jgi:hypothetical protein
MMKMKPHAMFETTRADEVAECWDGIPEDLYIKLWNVIVPKQKEIPNLEDSGPHDHIGFENLAAHWNDLTEDEQRLLNDLAKKQEEEIQEWWNKRREV